jgi:organic radical activating enzyme
MVTDLYEIPSDEYFKRDTSGLTETAVVPTNTYIETNDTCNLNCIMCRTKDSVRQKGAMPLEAFERHVAQMYRDGGRATTIHSIGDPLVNNNIEEYLKILRKNKVGISFLSSNCQFLHRHIDTILSYRDVISALRPSVDAASKATYELVRDGASWERLHDNLLMFKRENDKLARPMDIRFSTCVSKANFHEIAYIPSVFSYISAPTTHSFSFANWKGPSLKDMERFNYFPGQLHHSAPCSMLWDTTIILKEGTLSVCCNDFDGGVVFGSADKDRKAEFNNETIRAFRRAHMANDRDNMPELCRECYRVDPRYGVLVSELICWFYATGKKHPVYLQQSLNRIGPMLQDRKFPEILPEIEKLASL